LGQQRELVRLRGEVFGPEHSGADFMGIQILSPAARERLPEEGCLVGDVYLPALRARERIDVVLHEGGWDDIGTPRALLEANLGWLGRNRLGSWSAVQVPDGIKLQHSVACAGAHLEGEGVLARCLVLPGASLRAPAHDVIAMPGGVCVQT
jgi:mannose-1-phosphate guanylyltransferase